MQIEAERAKKMQIEAEHAKNEHAHYTQQEAELAHQIQQFQLDVDHAHQIQDLEHLRQAQQMQQEAEPRRDSITVFIVCI